MAIADLLECTIDFEGQKLADQLTHLLLVATAVIAFAAGYAVESLMLTMATFGAGLILTALVVLPPWPLYNRNPQPWLSASEYPATGEKKKD